MARQTKILMSSILYNVIHCKCSLKFIIVISAYPSLISNYSKKHSKSGQDIVFGLFSYNIFMCPKVPSLKVSGAS